MRADYPVAAEDRFVDFKAAIKAWTGTAVVGDSVIDAALLLQSIATIRADLARIGVGPGDLIFVAGGQHPDTLAAVVAAIDLGAMAAPVNPLTAPAMLEALVDGTGPTGIVVTRERSKAVARVFSGGEAEMDGTRLTYLAAVDPVRGATPIGSLGLVSSGTTGTPKIVAHYPSSALRNGRLHAEAIGLGADDCLLMTLPLHFSFGFVACLVGCIASGASLAIQEPPMTAAVFAAMIAKSGATVYSATPAMLRRVITDAPIPEGLRVISVGGDALPIEEVGRIRAHFAGRLYLTYGLSEAGPRVFTREVLVGDTAPYDLGPALAGVTHRLGALAPDHTFAVPSGYQIGELQLLTPTAMLGLWGRNGLNQRDFDGDWLKTGDIALQSPDGKLFFHDRIKNVIVSGGEKISSGLIRRVLLEHADVVAAKIWAEPDETLGQIPVASVRLRDDSVHREEIVLEDIHAWSAKRLRRLERPRRIVADRTLAIMLK